MRRQNRQGEKLSLARTGAELFAGRGIGYGENDLSGLAHVPSSARGRTGAQPRPHHWDPGAGE